MDTSTLSQTAHVSDASQSSRFSTVWRVRDRAVGALAKLDWLALLLPRLAIGLLFLSTGWGKVHDLGKVTEFFVSLHIPLPGLNAVVVGYSELICGAALVVGLLSRLATLPLIVSMIVAILTARIDDVGGLLDLVGIEEFTYLVVLTMIAILGPGRASVDAWLVRRFHQPDRTRTVQS